MSYQVIARKYRPQRFSDVVGQEHVTQTLANAVKQNRIAHAYLFVGPRGTGKTTIARIFAKCLNCTDGPKVDFPDDDSRCQEIAEGRSLDVLEIDGASNRGIEEIRELRETVKYAPASSKFKIYIIDEVHMLTKEAFNALLKTLEEPPGHVKFMFATTEPEKVLPTILSRCQRFDLRRIPVPLIAGHLAQIARQEEIRIDEPALNAIARGAEGGMRDAESALDQLISFCGNTITEADVLSMFGLTAQSQILALAGGILRGEPESVLQELDQLSKHGKDLGRLLSDLLNHFRNLLIYQVSRGNMKLLEVSENETHVLQEESSLSDADHLTRIMEILTEAESRFRDSASKKIFVEVSLLKAIQARQMVPLDGVLKQLHALRQTGSAISASSKPRPQAPSASTLKTTPLISTLKEAASTAPPAQASSSPTNLDQGPETAAAAGDLESLWEKLLDSVGRASAFTRSYLIEAHPLGLAKNVFTIGFDPEFSDQLELVNNQRTLTLVQTKLKELGLAGCHVKFIQAEAPPGRTPSGTAQAEKSNPTTEPPLSVPPSNPAGSSPPSIPQGEKSISAKENRGDFKNDPLIQKALEIFKGQIVEIRA